MPTKKVADTLPDSTIIENFDKFLRENGKRRTPERSMILECALEFHKPFTIEDLVEAMANKEFVVSQATIYNTVQLLVEAGVLRQFSVKTRGYYERVDNVSFIHLKCEHCGKVKLVKDTNFMAYMHARKFPAFTTSYYNFTVYGTCNDCARKIKQLKRKKNNDKNK